MAMRVITRGLNIGYRAASVLLRKRLLAMAERYPQAFVMSPEQVETQAAYRIAPTLQHVILDVTGQEPPLEQIQSLVIEGYRSGLFHNYGEAVFINEHRVPALMGRISLIEKISLPIEKEEAFTKEALKHGLLQDSMHTSQIVGSLMSVPRAPQRGQYLERPYTITTRDHAMLQLGRIVNQRLVKTNDDSESILLVPGIACKGDCFDLNNEMSLALLLADLGTWVYKFDFRGLGRNKGNFDYQCFLDTLVSNDLPAGLDFIYNRPTPKKPAIVLAHSMGGMVAVFLLVRQAYKLRLLLEKLGINSKGMTRPEIEAILTQYSSSSEEDCIIIAEAMTHLAMLKTVKSLITLASAFSFDKNHHYIFPMVLGLNILLPSLGYEEVPVDKVKGLVKLLPFDLFPLKSLVNRNNFDDVKVFLSLFIEKGTDSFPLGVGFQLLRAIFSGKGIKRMDEGRFNYSAHLDEIPPDIPIFHIYGATDPLAPAYNLAFIDKAYAQGTTLDFSTFPAYQHRHQAVHPISADTKIEDIPLPQSSSQVQGFLVDGISHLDQFYGRTAEEKVIPLLTRLIHTIGQVT